MVRRTMVLIKILYLFSFRSERRKMTSPIPRTKKRKVSENVEFSFLMKSWKKLRKEVCNPTTHYSEWFNPRSSLYTRISRKNSLWRKVEKVPLSKNSKCQKSPLGRKNEKCWKSSETDFGIGPEKSIPPWNRNRNRKSHILLFDSKSNGSGPDLIWAFVTEIQTVFEHDKYSNLPPSPSHLVSQDWKHTYPM